jgi:hypothetical protein
VRYRGCGCLVGKQPFLNDSISPQEVGQVENSGWKLIVRHNPRFSGISIRFAARERSLHRDSVPHIKGFKSVWVCQGSTQTPINRLFWEWLVVNRENAGALPEAAGKLEADFWSVI